jgi:hypothetical protein
MKFDLEWFKRNKDTADRILNFNQKLLWFKQNVICKITKDKAEFYLLDKERFDRKKKKYPIIAKLNEIKIESNRFVYVEDKDPLRNEKVWILAEKLGYYKFPRTWIRISKWFSKEFVKFCFKQKDDKIICYLKDKFGNRFYLPAEAIAEMNSIKQKLETKEFKRYADYLRTVQLEKCARFLIRK